ncbi:hypothetical protein LCGC14_1287000 [marine sediment metagenome]|uniref:Uncharacterized protein n=1 Tax=marine sediment metagenome TaxID=412755 RepID=A0A0F9NWI4_9ZZZZ
MQKGKFRIRELKSPKLRKIRYELRTLLFLEFVNRIKKNGTRELYLPFRRRPICCATCRNRMEDLIQDPNSLFWFCKDHFDLDFDFKEEANESLREGMIY